ncbi:Hypothetical predicted protein [Paramuricea clavata]|uniref:Uncharacterized protein n=1 Tax=Paramuricea clavata TaxID=317549 RepID=A0A7D9HFX4_PARCT|nr:Hypothetical predicted protein [Paramuricea clavata]
MHRNKTKDTLQLPRVIVGENLDENEGISELHDVKNFPSRLRTNSETSQDSVTSEPRNRRRSKRFEDALLKWQEYGNDIIERKPPNFLELKNKSRKGTWICAGGKYNEKSEIDASREKDKLYQKQVKELAGRLSDNLREFQEMHERSAKIELTLKQLKEKAMANLGNEQDFKI